MQNDFLPYVRVIPRDLFNESKLLKCVGRMSLLIHDGIEWPLSFVFDDKDCEDFQIHQCQNTGNLRVMNLHLMLEGREIVIASSYNSKENFPLLLITEDDEEIIVFEDCGRFTREFADFCNGFLV